MGKLMHSAFDAHYKILKNARSRNVELGDNIEHMKQQLSDLESRLRFSETENQDLRCKRIYSRSPSPTRKGTTNNKIIPDTVVAPSPFYGKRDKEDAQDWLEYFIRYAEFKGLSDKQRADLFIMMMRGSANDWLNAFTTQNRGPPNSDRLVEGFKDNYFRSAEFRWQDAGAMWQ